MGITMTTWRKELTEEMARYEETVADIVSNTMTDEEMDTEFEKHCGGAAGCPFTVWTTNRVYFPLMVDPNHVGVDSLPRHPCDEATEHIGYY